MKRILVILLLVVIVGLIYTNIARHRRFSAPSNYDYVMADSIDVHYYDPVIVREYIANANSLGQTARFLWQEHRIDVRFTGELSPEERLLVRQYTDVRNLVVYQEMLLKQSWKLKQEGYSNYDIQRMEEQGLSPQLLELEKAYGPLASLSWELGATGDYIRMIQQYLVNQGHSIPIDGRYGDQTAQAIQQVQRDAGQVATGKPNLRTLDIILNTKP